jgi:hypothetical protein
MPKDDAKDLLIGVVGNCVSGKTTLVAGLKEKGYQAVNIPQEHSVTPRFWRKFNVDFLVMLSCTLATAQTRRKIPWGQVRLDRQAAILADARANCQLYLPTDDFTIPEVLEQVIQAVEIWQRGEEKDGTA